MVTERCYFFQDRHPARDWARVSDRQRVRGVRRGAVPPLGAGRARCCGTRPGRESCQRQSQQLPVPLRHWGETVVGSQFIPTESFVAPAHSHSVDAYTSNHLCLFGLFFGGRGGVRVGEYWCGRRKEGAGGFGDQLFWVSVPGNLWLQLTDPVPIQSPPILQDASACSPSIQQQEYNTVLSYKDWFDYQL